MYENHEYDNELLNIQTYIYKSFYPSIFISKILVLSTLTAFFICKLCNQPFVNPKIYNSRPFVIDKINTLVDVCKGILVNYNIVYFSLSRYYLYTETPPYQQEQRIVNIVQFLFVLEFIAYWYHRLSHEITTIFKHSHKDHHINIEVYPIDFLEFDYIDNIVQTLYMNIPLYFVPIHIHDYVIIYYFYGTAAFLMHSPLLTNHHTIHHRRFKCNYSLLCPLFDILFGTYVGHHHT